MMDHVTELNFNYNKLLMGEAPVKQSEYHPFTFEEYQSIKEDLSGIKAFLPTHLMGPFWSRCNRLRGVNTPQPCSCASAAGHWGSCVEELRNYVSKFDGQ